MVSAGITADRKAPLIFVENGIKINKINYLEDILKKKRLFLGHLCILKMATGLISSILRPHTRLKWYRSNALTIFRISSQPKSTSAAWTSIRWTPQSSLCRRAKHAQHPTRTPLTLNELCKMAGTRLMKKSCSVNAFPRGLKKYIGAKRGHLEILLIFICAW